MANKTFQVLNASEQQKLSTIFPSIENLHYWDYGNDKRLTLANPHVERLLVENNYKWLYISVYDHWLSREDEKDKEQIEEFFKFNDENHPKSILLSEFNLKLFQNTNVLNFRPIGKKNYSLNRKKKISFRKFVSFEKFKLVAGSPRNYFFPNLVLPDLKAIYFPGKNLAHLLIYKDADLLHGLKKWVAESNLYIINE